MLVVFVLKWLSLQWEILNLLLSVSINFPSNSHRDAPFYHIACDYAHDDLDSLRDHLRDVPWEDIFKLGAFAAASEFCD